MITDLIIIVISVYVLISIVVFFMANSNILPWRRFERYTLELPLSLQYFDSTLDKSKKVAYWKGIQDEKQPTVILLHGFTRNSKKMERRAKIYWDMGYNIYLVDNLGHGYSSHILFPSGFRFYKEVRKLIDIENIDQPILHGASMGAIASSYLAQKNPEIPRMIICEALPYTFENLYVELLRYTHIPYWLFPWVGVASRNVVWKQFDGFDISYDPTQIECPMYLIHSKTDDLFRYKDHFEPIISNIDDGEDVETWLVDNAKHTRMDSKDAYPQNLRSFVKSHN